MTTAQTIEQLRRNGYTVYVKHYRVFEVNGQPVGAGIIGEKVSKVDNILTRGEFERTLEDGNLFVDDGNELHFLNLASYGDCVSPRGGFTEVQIFDKDTQIGRGKYNFNHKAFCRKKGLNAALGRALKGV